MIQIVVSQSSIEMVARMDRLPINIRKALIAKMEEVVREIYAKIHNALPTFQYDYGVTEIGSSVIGFIEPSEPKAIAREFGGKSYYEILPSKARLLRFIGSKDGKTVFAPRVFHPPSREFRDVRNVIDSSHSEIKAQLEQAIKGNIS